MSTTGSVLTYVTCMRSGIQISQHTYVQIDLSTLYIVGDKGMAQPVTRYMCYTRTGVPDFRTKDLLLDELNLDKNGNSVQYRVNGKPDGVYGNHLEVEVERVGEV